jgi:hypothetical protein
MGFTVGTQSLRDATPTRVVLGPAPPGPAAKAVQVTSSGAGRDGAPSFERQRGGGDLQAFT